jgi:hypothetical protein
MNKESAAVFSKEHNWNPIVTCKKKNKDLKQRHFGQEV